MSLAVLRVVLQYMGGPGVLCSGFLSLLKETTWGAGVILVFRYSWDATEVFWPNQRVRSLMILIQIWMFLTY